VKNHIPCHENTFKEKQKQRFQTQEYWFTSQQALSFMPSARQVSSTNHSEEGVLD